MIKALIFSAIAASAAAHKGPKAKSAPAPPAPVINTCNDTCLSISITDFYGDGWDSVVFYGEEEGGASFSMYPDCARRELTRMVCPTSDGTHYFTAVHSNASYIPENYWEIFWTATSYNCDGSIANMFTGGFNSSLILDYVGNEWSAQYWENMWDNEKQCDACGDAQRCAPKKPKGKGGKGKGKGGKGKGKGGGKKPGNGGPGGQPMDGNGDTGNTTKVAKPKPRYGPPAVDLRLTMYDEYGDGWWKNDYSGESWYLADDRRERLFHTGTLCDGSVGYCNLCLGDGSYTLRFTGDAANFTAWDFCGVTGQRATELAFRVEKGKCYAESVVSLATDCAGAVESHVTLTGVVAVSGFSSEFVDQSTFSVVSSAIADVVGFGSDRVAVVSTTLDNRVMTSVSNVVQAYTFEMSFVAEDAPFKTDGRSFAAVESLAASIATSLSNSMYSGQFETKLQMESTLQNVVSFSSRSVAELVSLEVSSITYVGSETMIASALPTLSYDESSSSSYSGSSLLEGAGFLGLVVVGFVAFVGIMSTGLKKYDPLPVDSTHHTVHSSEMDNSLSPFGQQSMFEVDATPTSTLNL